MVKKRIAVIGLKGLPAFGGAANAGENIIEQLAGEYDFTVYATETHTSWKGDYKGVRQIVFRKFPVRGLNVFYYYIVSAFHAVFREKYDLIHLHQMDGAFILLLLRLKYKVVATSHGLTYKTGKWSRMLYPYFKWNEWCQAKLSNHLTVVARSLVAHYARLVPVTRITYIPNGITLATSGPPGTDLKGYILFAAGRIIPIKGLHFLLASLHTCAYKGKIVVLGDYEQVKGYKQQLMSLAAGLDIEFRGLIKNKELLNTYIANAGLFVFPSTQEAMSMMLLEVVALKTPVICSDIIQNSDIFNEGEVLFFRSGDADDLAGRLSWALENPGKMRELAENACASLAEKYQWPIISRQYQAVFESVLK
jgi:glycosyltransferase involved in cell wall biosynthesis